jgi:hypothetical protein
MKVKLESPIFNGYFSLKIPLNIDSFLMHRSTLKTVWSASDYLLGEFFTVFGVDQLFYFYRQGLTRPDQEFVRNDYPLLIIPKKCEDIDPNTIHVLEEIVLKFTFLFSNYTILAR